MEKIYEVFKSEAKGNIYFEIESAKDGDAMLYTANGGSICVSEVPTFSCSVADLLEKIEACDDPETVCRYGAEIEKKAEDADEVWELLYDSATERG